MRRAAPFIMMMALATTAAWGAVKAYDVDVYCNCLAQTQPYTPVGQYFRMCVDSLTKVSVWVGDKTNGGEKGT
jgi:hypothetical protein